MRGTGELLLLGVLALAAACSGPESPWAKAPPLALDLKCTVEPEEVALMQPLQVVLDLYRQADVEVAFEPEVDENEFLCERAVFPEVPLGEGFWLRTALKLRPVRGPGELKIPSFVARSEDGEHVASTPERTIEVTSLLAGHAPEIEPPAAPFPARPRYWLWIGVSLGAIALVALFWFFARRKKARSEYAETAVPPHILALRALARLRTLPRETSAQIESFYVEVSDVLRDYLEERFGLRAPEQTTEEFLRALESGAALAREHRGELQQFLQQCDLVKFAAFRPVEKDHLAAFAIAEAFVERTRVDRIGVEPAARVGAEEGQP